MKFNTQEIVTALFIALVSGVLAWFGSQIGQISTITEKVTIIETRMEKLEDVGKNVDMIHDLDKRLYLIELGFKPQEKEE